MRRGNSGNQSFGSLPSSAITSRATPVVSARPDSTARDRKHTSELQSLMSISYAVFCLKKKRKFTHQSQPDATSRTTSHQTPAQSSTYQGPSSYPTPYIHTQQI